MAPSPRAAPIAARPATPAPITRTFAGGTLPAAVNCPVKKLPNSFDASTTARYPAMLAVELKASIFWAREMRGTWSTPSVVTPRSARALTVSSFCAGKMKEMSVEPSARRSISAGTSGARTLRTTSLPKAPSASVIVAPSLT